MKSVRVLFTNQVRRLLLQNDLGHRSKPSIRGWAHFRTMRSLFVAIAITVQAFNAESGMRPDSKNQPTRSVPNLDVRMLAKAAIDQTKETDRKRKAELLDSLQSIDSGIGQIAHRLFAVQFEEFISLGPWVNNTSSALQLLSGGLALLKFVYPALPFPGAPKAGAKELLLVSSGVGVLGSGSALALNSFDRDLNKSRAVLAETQYALDHFLFALDEMSRTNTQLTAKEKWELSNHIQKLNRHRHVLQIQKDDAAQIKALSSASGALLTVSAYFLAPSDRMKTVLMGLGGLLSSFGSIQQLKSSSMSPEMLRLKHSLEQLRVQLTLLIAPLRDELGNQ